LEHDFQQNFAPFIRGYVDGACQNARVAHTPYPIHRSCMPDPTQPKLLIFNRRSGIQFSLSNPPPSSICMTSESQYSFPSFPICMLNHNTLFPHPHNTRSLPHSIVHSQLSTPKIYVPGGGWFIICACCSWNLAPILSLPAINFLTHRDTQPVSRWMRDLVVKSSMQESKQWVTRLENIWGCC
jgi:hypothetical protein